MHPFSRVKVGRDGRVKTVSRRAMTTQVLTLMPPSESIVQIKGDTYAF